MTERQPSWPATPPPAVPGHPASPGYPASAGPPGYPAVPGHPASSGYPAVPVPPGQFAVVASAGPFDVPGPPGHPAAASPFGASSVAPPPGSPSYGVGGHGRPPSGLFPGHSHPIYREPHPILAAPVLSGFGATLLWLALFGGLAHDLASYAWWTIVASITAWAMAIVLTVLGDRGVAVGIALASGLGLSIAVAFVGARWINTYDWPLW